MERTVIIGVVVVVLLLLVVRRIGCVGLLVLLVIVGGLLWWQWPHLLPEVSVALPWSLLLRWLSSHVHVVWS